MDGPLSASLQNNDPPEPPPGSPAGQQNNKPNNRNNNNNNNNPMWMVAAAGGVALGAALAANALRSRQQQSAVGDSLCTSESLSASTLPSHQQRGRCLLPDSQDEDWADLWSRIWPDGSGPIPDTAINNTAMPLAAKPSERDLADYAKRRMSKQMTLLCEEWGAYDDDNNRNVGDLVFGGMLPFHGHNVHVVVEVKYLDLSNEGKTARSRRTAQRKEVKDQATKYAWLWAQRDHRSYPVMVIGVALTNEEQLPCVWLTQQSRSDRVIQIAEPDWDGARWV